MEKKSIGTVHDVSPAGFFNPGDFSGVENALISYGWSYIRKDHSIETGWQGDLCDYRLLMTESDFFCRFEVNLINLSSLVTTSLFSRIYPQLLMLNNDLKCCKCSISPNGALTLLADLPKALIGEKVIHDLLGLIGYYADQVSREIMEFMVGNNHAYS